MELTKKALLAIKKKHRKVKLLPSHEEDLPTCHEGPATKDHQRSPPPSKPTDRGCLHSVPSS